MFSKAIVRRPCKNLVNGITSASLGIPDYEKALDQHANYIETMESLGIKVYVLDADERYPDSTFVEDVALCTPRVAILTNPGADSRRGEEVEMKSTLKEFYSDIEEIKAPGTLEAGDVMMVEDHYFIGLSTRTNEAGADQLIAILEQYGMTGQKVMLPELLHLKTGVSYLGNNTLLLGSQLFGHPLFTRFKKIRVIEKEVYAANSVWINGTVIVPGGFEITRNSIQAEGIETISVEVSEFQKLDGGLSCLSLRF